MSDNDSTRWNKILAAVLSMPGVKVDRVAYLRKELKPYCNEQKLDMLYNVRPYTLVSDKVIDSLAASCINYHTALATTGSTIAGLPGGLALAATIPGDLTQYYFHVFVLSQKLAYLYGFPDFCDEDGQLGEVASSLLTIFMGTMMGVRVADQGLSELSKGLAKSAVGRLPRVIITKTAIYPVVMQIARLAGTKLTRDGLTKSIGKFIPIAGGVFSGTLTLFTFRPGAHRLQQRLKAQKKYLTDADVSELSFDQIHSSFVKAEQTQADPHAKRLAVLQAMVNMANISDDLSSDMQDLIEERIAQADLSDKEQLALLETLGTEYSIDVDYDLLSCEPEYAQETLQGLIDVMRVAGRQSMAEKMYLTMTAKALGVSKEELDQMLQTQ